MVCGISHNLTIQIPQFKLLFFPVITGCNNSLVFKSGSPSDTFQDIDLRGNFLNLGSKSGVLFTGVAGTYNNVRVQLQATVPGSTRFARVMVSASGNSWG